MKKLVAIVIPYYHNILTEIEQIAFRQCIKVLSGYPIILIVPDGMKVSIDLYTLGLETINVPTQWLESVATYNRMMLDTNFYNLFLDYEYILIYQLDAFVFYDKLTEFCNLGYDYIGAPWLFGAEYLKNTKGNIKYVGNGGLSLRRVESAIKILKKNPVYDKDMPEDVYWSICDSQEFNIAPKELALHFSIEEPAERMFYLNQKRLPFGCHAWNKKSLSFWRPIIEKYGYVFSEKSISNDTDKYEKLPHSIWEVPCDDVRNGIEKLLLKKEPIYVWGAGAIGTSWVIALRCAKTSVKCIDNNMECWGNYLWDVCIEPPDKLKEVKEHTIVIIAVKSHRKEIMGQLLQMGVLYKLNILFYENILETFYSQV